VGRVTFLSGLIIRVSLTFITVIVILKDFPKVFTYFKFHQQSRIYAT